MITRDVTSGLPLRARLSMAGLVMFEFPSNGNGAAYLNKRTSLETSNIALAAGFCCVAVVCKVSEIGACEKDTQGEQKGN